MDRLTADEIAARLAPHLKTAGLEPLSLDVVPDDDFPELPIARVTVSLKDTTPEAVNRRMLAAERAMSRAFRYHVRAGYYDARGGYDVPRGRAMLEIDALPFALAAPAPKP